MPPAADNLDLDPERAEAFANRFVSELNHRAMCLVDSIGHRTGLFDSMRDPPPMTSEEIGTRRALRAGMAGSNGNVANHRCRS